MLKRCQWCALAWWLRLGGEECRLAKGYAGESGVKARRPVCVDEPSAGTGVFKQADGEVIGGKVVGGEGRGGTSQVLTLGRRPVRVVAALNERDW